METGSYNPRERIMKKVLLTTTALVMTAGVAAAEIKFSGTAQVAITDDNGAHAATVTAASLEAALAAATEAQAAADRVAANDGAATAAVQTANDTAATAAATAVTAATTAANTGAAAANTTARAANNDFQLTTGFDFDVTISAAADNGITMSTSFDMGAGELVDYNDDDQREAQSDALGAPELTIGYMGYTFSAQQDGVDNLYNGDLPGTDLGVSGAMGGVTFAVTGDLDTDNTSYKLGYTTGDLTVTVTGTDDENGTAVAGKASASAISASYKMGDLTLTASTDNEGDADSTNKVGFSYAMDSLTFAYTSIDPSAAGKGQGDEWDASVSYAAGAMTASYAIDEADASTLIGTYALGGGTTLFAAMHDKAGEDTDMTTIGMNFAF
jgi:hypothetical protein